MADAAVLIAQREGENERGAFAFERYAVTNALSPADAFSAIGIPDIGDAYPANTSIRVTQREAELNEAADRVNSSGDPARFYYIEVEYGTGSGSITTLPTPPLTPFVTWDFGVETDRQELDIGTGRTIGQTRLMQLVNNDVSWVPADSFSLEIGADIVVPTIGIQVVKPLGTNVSDLDLAAFLSAVGTCNESTVSVDGYTIPAETMLYLGPQFQDAQGGGKYVVHRHQIGRKTGLQSLGVPIVSGFQGDPDNGANVAWLRDDLPIRYALWPFYMYDADEQRPILAHLRVSRRYGVRDFVAAGVV